MAPNKYIRERPARAPLSYYGLGVSKKQPIHTGQVTFCGDKVVPYDPDPKFPNTAAGRKKKAAYQAMKERNIQKANALVFKRKIEMDVRDGLLPPSELERLKEFSYLWEDEADGSPPNQTANTPNPTNPVASKTGGV